MNKLRREARIGFAIVGCLAAVLTYAAVKRMWLLAQATSNPSPAPTILAATTSAPSALAAKEDATAPVISLPSEPTSTAIYQEPVAAAPGVPFPSRFAIPPTSGEATPAVEQVATDSVAKVEAEPVSAAVDSAPVEAAPPLGSFSSRFSPTAPAEAAKPAPAEVATEATPQPNTMATPAVSAAIGAIASRFSAGVAPVETPQPATPATPKTPEPAQVATAPTPAADPEASLRFVGEKPVEKPVETPGQARLIKPAPVVKAKPQTPAAVIAATSPETKLTTPPLWKASDVAIEPQQSKTAAAKPQGRLNRAFASTASASLPTTTYVPAQNASTTKRVIADDNTPQRLPPTIEVATGTEKGVTQEADPSWVQQMITGGSFIPGQRIVPTQSPQPLPISSGAQAQPLANLPAVIPPTASAPSTYVVRPGDDLATIARQTLGDAARWGELFRLNRDVIGDYPDQMKPGMELRLPQE